jgi:3-methyladenine DNA glycosylase AlkD
LEGEDFSKIVTTITKDFDRNLFSTFNIIENKEIAQKQAQYMRNRFEFIGLMRDDIKRLRTEFESTQGKVKKQDAFQYCIECTKYAEREMWYVGFNALEGYKKFYKYEDLKILKKWVEQSDWWDIVDIIASHHLGEIAMVSEEAKSEIQNWMLSPNFWLRRCAILYQLKYKQKTDAEFLFFVCKELAFEKEFFIRKAIGWALREYSKSNPNAVKAFIQENNSLLSPLSIKEGSKYL